MARRSWKVVFPEGEHVVDFEHGYWSGRRTLVVDGRAVALETRRLIDMGGDVPFEIAGHPCVVVIKSNGLTFTYDLEVDGKSVTTGLGRSSAEKGEPLPGWVMLGATACIAIPFVSLGGVVPALIGGLGATACVRIGRGNMGSSAARMLGVGGVVVGAWLAFGAFALAVRRAR